jgi:hypothetical protein
VRTAQSKDKSLQLKASGNPIREKDSKIELSVLADVSERKREIHLLFEGLKDE